ncbi:hypothetical protein [Shumkonia mesophila]|uniref:hypothetical protein n=1 Tax=Shumkonia mesophila TaxID=2838854 RepID=UPI0029352685|nr:hypothetical protein [Shumkonia mesophila]
MSFGKACVVAIAGLLALASLSGTVAAFDPKAAVALIDDAMIKEIHGWLDAPVVRISVEAQNKRHATLSQARIDELDKQWVAERKNEEQPLIAATLSSPLSNYLTQIQAASDGLYTEIFVMDFKGLNVGQSSISSDYWQGDEGKFQKTFPVGPGAVFVDKAGLDEDTKTWRAQVNLTVVDAAGKAIGAITVEVNLTELDRRRNG